VDSWPSSPSIFNLGHKAIADLLNHKVLIEEKVDGSQFSFGVDEDGELHVRSKGAVIYPEAPEKMFNFAVDVAKTIKSQLHVGWTYRAEYLKTPKHNALAYDRVPTNHLIVFDINTGNESYLSYFAKEEEADRIGLECIPLLWSGNNPTLELLRELLSLVSRLGGQKIEGVVIKPANYDLLGADKKVLMGKFVSEAFKEVHSASWKEGNPSSQDIVTKIGKMYKTPARWNKAIQHLRERGLLEDSPKDIGILLKEVSIDVLKEEEEAIKEALFKWGWPKISRHINSGLPEWYKEELMKKQFNG
jgi:ATP-dependent RNA circularization protein (DNA/RNA ligase family)